jgi:hypothetical protein
VLSATGAPHERAHDLVRGHVARVGGIGRALGEGHDEHVGPRTALLRAPLAADHRRDEELSPVLLRAAQEALKARTGRALPHGVGGGERRGAVALERQPLLVVEAGALVLEGGDEHAQPLAVRGGGERLGEELDGACRLLIARPLRIAARLHERRGRRAQHVPRREGEGDELRVEGERRIRREPLAQPVALGVELCEHVGARAACADRVAVAAAEDRHARGVVDDEGEPVQPQVDVLARAHRPRDGGLRGGRRRARRRGLRGGGVRRRGARGAGEERDGDGRTRERAERVGHARSREAGGWQKERGVRRAGHEPSARAGASTSRPQVMQNRQAASSSVLHAGQRRTVRFSPQ